MSQYLTLALDAMGGDKGLKVVVPAALASLERHQKLKLILVGDLQEMQQHLDNLSYDKQRLVLQPASQQVEMDESPALALRNKKDSSMRVAINLVKQQQASACVSAGNTGALMAIARFVLKTLPGIDRPAIIRAMPTLHQKKSVRVLDLGANVDCKAEHLFQFAVMGSALASAVDNVAKPKVALLNIGTEETKGNEQVKQAAQFFSQEASINYVGFIEGDKLYSGDVDVIVCDGFVGNIALKVSEGITKLTLSLTKQAFTSNWKGLLAGLIARPLFRKLTKRFNPSHYNGASLLGLQGIVIKSHGGADVLGFASAIEQAILEVEKNVPEKIGYQIAQSLQTETIGLDGE